MSISENDKQILRRLAERVSNIANQPAMEETRQLWRRHNRLEPVGPLIFCDPENGWNEIITDEQIACTGEVARQWERILRKEIFWGETMGDDKPIEAVWNVHYVVSDDDWGIAPITTESTAQNGAFTWQSPIVDYDKDLPKLHPPECTINEQASNRLYEMACDVFAPILDVRRKGVWWWSLGPTYLAARFRGLENIYADMIEQPDNLKHLLQLISEGYLQKMEYFESRQLLSLNNDCTYVGTGGWGYSDELPGDDFDGVVKCKHLWGNAESQETVGVSPQMYAEFIFPYEKPLLERFGLNCYGCCEPIDSRWEIIKQHHNLRRVSCSPWADCQKMAEMLSDQYILSLKPSPTPLSMPNMNEEVVRAELRQKIEWTKGCVVEIIMKDNHTLGNNPENATRWCAIAREEVRRAYGL